MQPISVPFVPGYETLEKLPAGPIDKARAETNAAKIFAKMEPTLQARLPKAVIQSICETVQARWQQGDFVASKKRNGATISSGFSCFKKGEERELFLSLTKRIYPAPDAERKYPDMRIHDYLYVRLDKDGNVDVVEEAIKRFVPFQQTDRPCYDAFSHDLALIHALESPYCPHTYREAKYKGNKTEMLAIFQRKDEMDLQTYYDSTDAFSSLEPDTAMEIARGCIEAVRFLHGKNVVHRDLKLQNFLINTKRGKKAEIHITDFGHSRFAHDPLLRLCGYGTDIWSPPESVPGTGVSHPVTKKADIWALGLLLYALAGQTHNNFIVAPELFALDTRIRSEEELLSLFKDIQDPMLLMQLEVVDGLKKQRTLLVEELNPSKIVESEKLPMLTHLAKQMLRQQPEERIDIEEVWQQFNSATRP